MLKVAIEFLSKMSILYHILLAPQSGAHRIAPHRDPSNPIQSIQPTYSCILRGKAERITPNYNYPKFTIMCEAKPSALPQITITPNYNYPKLQLLKLQLPKIYNYVCVIISWLVRLHGRSSTGGPAGRAGDVRKGRSSGGPLGAGRAVRRAVRAVMGT